MRDISIISIIRRYGLNSKKLDPKYRVRFLDTLSDMEQFSTESLKLVEVIDNISEPEKSYSNRCQIPGCGKKIRYEAHVLNTDAGEYITCGSNCCCTLLGLSKIRIRNFMKIEEALKEKTELEQWKKDNPEIVKKLELFSKYDLPFFQPFINEVRYSALNPEDTSYINEVNTKLVIDDLNYLSMLDDLIRDDPKEIYKSIRDHVLEKGRYLSTRQKSFIEREYEQMLENRFDVTFSIFNAYNYKDKLKELGFTFNGKDKSWQKTVKGFEASGLRDRLENLKIQYKNIRTD